MRIITRRGFLRTALILGVPVGFPRWVRSDGATEKKPRPRVVRVTGPMEEALDLLLESLGGMKRFVRPGSTVLVKPNMSFPTPPEQAVTTDPGLVRAVIRHCLSAGARRVLVADNPMRATRLSLEMTGMRDACSGLRGVHLIGADREGMFREVVVKGGEVLGSTKVLRAALDADVKINIPRMKSHGATTVSLGTKGNMGLIWDRASFHGAMDLNEAIGDLNTLIRADLTILDGSSALTAGGPLGPGPVEVLNCLIGGTDPVAVDAVGVEQVAWYGRRVRPDQVKHLVACHNRGVGEIDPDRMDVVAHSC